MKQILFSMALLCLISFAAKAQYPTMAFKNNTLCTVYVQYYGSTSAACSVTHSSAIIAVPGGGTLPYTDPSMAPGWTLGASDYFLGMRVFYIYTPCRPLPTMFVDMSDCPSIGVMSAPSNLLVDVACNPTCASATGAVTFTVVNSTTASVTVNP